MRRLSILVEQSQRGDERAYAAVIEEFKNMAYGYAFSIVGDFHWAQDIAQEAFIDAWTCLRKLRIPEAFPAWFKKIVFKHCERFLRRRTHTMTDLDAAASVPSHELDDPASSTIRNEIRNQVIQAVKRLPEGKRSVVSLFYISGHSQEEIALFLSIPVGTVKSRLFAARNALKKEMMEMVEDMFRENGLPESFTESTVQKVLDEAKSLQNESNYEKAEQVLKTALNHAPKHPGILTALNRNLMQGYVFGQGEWDRLSEIVTQARVILDTGSKDEKVMRETAKTLLCIPKMTEAISFIKDVWIDRTGPSFEPLVMLAWAKGCTGDADAALRTWQTAVDTIEPGNPDNILQLQLGCRALVDCLVEAGYVEMGREAVRQGWNLAAEHGNCNWLAIFHQAGIDYHEIAQTLLDRSTAIDDADRRKGERLAITVWTEDFDVFLEEWLLWIRSLTGAAGIACPESVRLAIRSAFRAKKQPKEFHRWTLETWDAFREVKLLETESESSMWNWHQHDAWLHIESGELDEAERIVRRAISLEGYRWYAPMLIQIAALRGEPTPADLRDELEKGGVDAVDDYGMFGMYLKARLAAEFGKKEEALDALRKALMYWRNPPLFCVNAWENDSAWGPMLEMLERKRLFDRKRDSIGPVYGDLHYFPGW